MNKTFSPTKLMKYGYTIVYYDKDPKGEIKYKYNILSYNQFVLETKKVNTLFVFKGRNKIAFDYSNEKKLSLKDCIDGSLGIHWHNEKFERCCLETTNDIMKRIKNEENKRKGK